MNDVQYTVLSAYVRDLADRLLLADWELRLMRDPADEGNYAAVFVFDTENYAQVRVCNEFFAHPPEDQREWITHELIHCHIDRPQRVMEQLAAQFDENSATKFAKDAHGKEVEIVVQRFARLLAPLMPLPELPAGINL